MFKEYSTELGSVPVSWTKSMIDNANWHCMPFHTDENLQPAKDAGYTDKHLEFWSSYHYDVGSETASRYYFGDLQDPYWQQIKSTVNAFPNPEWCTLRWQKMLPGNVYPPHIDPTPHINYRNYWKNRRGLEVPMKDDDDIRRAIVFAWDHKPGHFSVVEGKMFYDWKMGDYVYFGRKSHAAGNFGHHDRIILLVTYFLNDDQKEQNQLDI